MAGWLMFMKVQFYENWKWLDGAWNYLFIFIHGLFQWFLNGVLKDILVLQLLANCAMSFWTYKSLCQIKYSV